MVTIKKKKQIEILREGGKRLKSVMDEIEKNIKSGESLQKLDEIAEMNILKLGGTPAFKNYSNGGKEPYPASICASLNDEVVHGIPRKEKIIKERDVLKIDVGMEYDGMFTDMARTFCVGKVGFNEKRLVDITEKSFWQGIGKLKEGAMLSDYSKAVQKFVEKNGFSIVRDLVGHGIGEKLHEDPQILNYYNGYYRDLKLKAGMVFAFEPMVNEGSFHTKIDKDGWVFRTRDGKLSAHYENTVLVTEKGCEVLTN